MKVSSMIVATLVLLCVRRRPVFGQTYNQTVNIIKDVLENGNYYPDVRPLKDQSQIINIVVAFALVSIVSIDDVTQTFTANGFLSFDWRDEILVWEPSEYGNQTIIHPLPEKIWRPRVVLINTLGDRDLFKDDVAPVMITNTGEASWAPGGLFPTSCELHLTNYPFDEQTCTIQLIAMTYGTQELVFQPDSDKVLLNFFVRHGEWDLTNSTVNVTVLTTGTWEVSAIQLIFVLKRRPTFLIVNIVLPVVFLSFLNILVFVIPADSGEKISYGITVLLALSVFLSIVSSMLPRTGTDAPKLTVYLFLLLIISMLTVIDSIIIVYLAHKDEQETTHQRAKDNFQNAFSKTQKLTKTLSSIINNKEDDDNSRRQDKLASIADAMKPRSQSGANANDDAYDAKETKRSPRINKYRLIGKHIDFLSLVVFLILWIAVTLGFLLDMAF